MQNWIEKYLKGAESSASMAVLCEAAGQHIDADNYMYSARDSLAAALGRTVRAETPSDIHAFVSAVRAGEISPAQPDQEDAPAEAA